MMRTKPEAGVGGRVRDAEPGAGANIDRNQSTFAPPFTRRRKELLSQVAAVAAGDRKNDLNQAPFRRR
jgi:hypothetical protein